MSPLQKGNNNVPERITNRPPGCHGGVNCRIFALILFSFADVANVVPNASLAAPEAVLKTKPSTKGGKLRGLLAVAGRSTGRVMPTA
jgi:hypothetical protein